MPLSRALPADGTDNTSVRQFVRPTESGFESSSHAVQRHGILEALCCTWQAVAATFEGHLQPSSACCALSQSGSTFVLMENHGSNDGALSAHLHQQENQYILLKKKSFVSLCEPERKTWFLHKVVKHYKRHHRLQCQCSEDIVPSLWSSWFLGDTAFLPQGITTTFAKASIAW